MADPDGVRVFRRKPQRDDDSLTVARYTGRVTLDALTAVARMADSRAELAEVPLSSGTVLLVRWVDIRDDHPPAAQWEVIEPGGYLAYSHGNGSLFDTDQADLDHWYDEAT